MTLDQVLWLSSRAAALTAFFTLAAALLTGQALRSAMFEGAMRNRELSNLHRFLTICWVPFVLLHVLTMTLDSVARTSPVDLFIPFRQINISKTTHPFESVIKLVQKNKL